MTTDFPPETRAQIRERLGGYCDHPGWVVPFKERFAIAGSEWSNFGLVVSLVAVLVGKERGKVR